MELSSVKNGVWGRAPGEWVADKPTKRRESALPAGTIPGATWLGSEGKAFPSFFLPVYFFDGKINL